MGEKISTLDALRMVATSAKEYVDGQIEYLEENIGNAGEAVVENVKPDWNATAGSDAEILNKPTTMTPAAHRDSHKTDGTDALTAFDIGAAAASHTHNISDINGIYNFLSSDVPEHAHYVDEITDFPETMMPDSHASTHGANGADPISPVSIGAAPAVHNHTKAEITDFEHTHTAEEISGVQEKTIHMAYMFPDATGQENFLCEDNMIHQICNLDVPLVVETPSNEFMSEIRVEFSSNANAGIILPSRYSNKIIGIVPEIEAGNAYVIVLTDFDAVIAKVGAGE